jgi:predicted nucleotidyltransferase
MERRKQILLWIKQVLDTHLVNASYQAFVFGSQANKVSLSRSDIDIGVMVDGGVNSIQLSRIMADIEELPMLYKIDLVNFNEVDEQFKLVALQNIERL